MTWKRWKGKGVTAQFVKAAGDAVENAVHTTGEQSDTQVPHDTGELMQSKTIMRDPNNSLRTWIGYGGGGVSGIAKVPYAKWWHENPANFQKGRKHNYLRDPAKTTLTMVLKTELLKIGLK